MAKGSTRNAPARSPWRLLGLALVLASTGCQLQGNAKPVSSLVAENTEAATFDEQVVLPLMNVYCAGCHGPSSTQAFKLGDAVQSRQAVLDHFDDIVARLTRQASENPAAPAFMPPAGKEGIPDFGMPEIPASAEFSQLLSAPGDYRALLGGLLGEDAATNVLVTALRANTCAGCHNSDEYPEALRFLLPGMSATETLAVLAENRDWFFDAVSERRMPPPDSIGAIHLKRDPEYRLRVMALLEQ